MSDTVTNPSKSPEHDYRATNAGFIDAKHEAFRQWTLIGKDDKQITQTASELLEGSKLRVTRELMIANLAGVFKRVREWCDMNHQQVNAALLAGKPGKLSLFFVASAERYDVDLDEKMTDLEVQLGGSAGVGSVESFQIPQRSMDQFVDKNAILLWEGASESSESVAGNSSR